MVFSINPTAEKTHAQFQAKAIEQKGEGEPSAIVGGEPSAPPAGEAPQATESGGAVESGSPVEAPEGVETGAGTIDGSGSCVCAVTCSNGNFPAMEAQGVGSFGGFGGMF